MGSQPDDGIVNKPIKESELDYWMEQRLNTPGNTQRAGNTA